MKAKLEASPCMLVFLAAAGFGVPGKSEQQLVLELHSQSLAMF